MKWLSSKEVKRILKQLKEEYEAEPLLDYQFLINHEDKVYIINNEIKNINFSILRTNTIGLYIGRLVKNELKLSIEGSQLIGPYAKKNTIELDDKLIQEWIRGFNIDLEGSHKGFVIIKNKNDYFGCGKHKENKILNMVPKERRIVSLRKV
jgi:NOL1/NOP2/fmu family ribosome biogenesis protein